MKMAARVSNCSSRFQNESSFRELPSITEDSNFLKTPSFTVLDAFLVIFSTIIFIADIGTDIIVIAHYFIGLHLMWAFLTLSLVIVPSVVVQIFSFRWFILDGFVSKVLWLTHISHLGVFYRYMILLKTGIVARKSGSLEDFKSFFRQQSDVCMLRLFESFMEAAPQLVLQLHIMVTTEDYNPWTGVSASASLISLSWGIAAYNKAMRNVRLDKKHLSWCGLVLQVSWRVGTVSSRVIAMVMFSSMYGPWLILILFLHWLGMTIWIIFQKTDFCTTWWEERLYNCVMGAIYCFCFFNLKEGHSRWRITSFYVITFIQNLAFVFAYCFSVKEEEKEYFFLGVILVPSGMIIGLSSMLLYYRYFHPNGPISLCSSAIKKGNGSEHTILCAEPKMLNSSSSPKDEHFSISVKSFKRSSNKSFSISPQSDNLSALRSNGWPEQKESSFIGPDSACCTSDCRSYAEHCSNDSIHNLSKSYSANQIVVHNNFSGMSYEWLSNHHRVVNYNFRPRAAFGKLYTHELHCSCLVLHDSDMEDKSLSFISFPSSPKSDRKETASKFNSIKLMCETNESSLSTKFAGRESLCNFYDGEISCESSMSMHHNKHLTYNESLCDFTDENRKDAEIENPVCCPEPQKMDKSNDICNQSNVHLSSIPHIYDEHIIRITINNHKT